MTEKLLQYIWQYRHFNASELTTTKDLPLQIIHQGNYNTNQGPDFLDGQIKFDGSIWAGSIELHVLASEWNDHGHSADENYKNVILHVVWKEDADIGLAFPTIELQDRIPHTLLKRYEELMQSPLFIPCQQHILHVNDLIISSWKQRMLIERLQNRSRHIQPLLEANNYHWEETFWWMIARNFGQKVNSEAFENIARSIPLNILAKHRNQIHQLEALLLGQAGILDKKFTESYPAMLSKEYAFLYKKYGLKKIHFPLHYLRMRPANFPTVRLAQLAALVHQSHHLFSSVKDLSDPEEVLRLLDVTANDYWHYHYIPDQPATFSKKKLGSQMINSIYVNRIIPVLYAYGYFTSSNQYIDKAIRWIETAEPERNSITNGFTSLGIANKSGYDSQALIQLKNEYCNYKMCLQCGIGAAILKS